MPTALPLPWDVTTWGLAHAGPAALAFARAAGLAWTAPALATPGLGARPRLLLAALLGAVLAPAVTAGAITPAPDLATIGPAAAAVAGEVLVGAALGWSAALVVAGARQAGELVGAQAGLAPAALFDAEAGDEMTALGHLYGLVALGVFLALDGPLVLVRALVESYRAVPPGGAFAAGSGFLEHPFAQVGQALALALRAAAPAALALALANVALGLLGRAAPGLLVMTAAAPVRAGLGLAAVLLGLAALAAALAAAWSAWPGGIGIGTEMGG
jgi:flagellar biosynthesis protein FliR